MPMHSVAPVCVMLSASSVGAACALTLKRTERVSLVQSKETLGEVRELSPMDHPSAPPESSLSLAVRSISGVSPAVSDLLIHRK